MSKSRGNVVNPFHALEGFGTDVLRYFLLKEGSLHNDGGVCLERQEEACVCVWCWCCVIACLNWGWGVSVPSIEVFCFMDHLPN